MSVNKYMHPRNMYRTPPNFKQMAVDYPEFRKYCTQDITGKVHIDFKNKETLRALTRTLLKKDFGLDVIIPLDRLIPTVPLRLNYVLWIEDLLSICTTEVKKQVNGIDIGTGASCIYPLLASSLYKWHMIGTELDVESLNTARENVERNHLQHLIHLKQSNNDSLLGPVLEAGDMYDFCMCNPPFYSSATDLDPKNKCRTERRPLPRNALTGNEGEVIATGGEIEFVSKLIKESAAFRTQVRIYTTMVGHKSSLPQLKLLLRNLNVESFKQTEFQQGHTTRWGLAWTFDHSINLRQVPQNTVVAARKKRRPPFTYVIPTDETKNVQLKQIVSQVCEMLRTLQFLFEELKHTQIAYAFRAVVHENTWSNQRRKRRQMLQKQNVNSNESDASMELDTSNDSVSTGSKRARSDEDEDNDDEYQEYYNKAKKFRSDSEPSFLKILVIVRKVESEFRLELEWIDGIVSKDAVHQVLQYFKNNLKL